MLDTRIAHNLVRENLAKLVKSPKAVIERAYRLTFDQIEKLSRRRTLSSRDLRRVVESNVLQKLRDRNYTAFVSTVNGSPILHCTCNAGDSVTGLVTISFCMRLTDGHCFEKSVACITPHAIARYVQRSGIEDFKAVFASLTVALGLTHALRDSFAKTDCKQIAIPAGDGLFVGGFGNYMPDKFKAHNDGVDPQLQAALTPDQSKVYLELSTWFVPGANDRDTHWRGVKTYFGLKLRKLDKVPAEELISEACLTANRMVKAPTIVACFPFLANEHSKRTDIVDQHWRMARMQANKAESKHLEVV